MRVSIYSPFELSQGTIVVPTNTNDLLTKALYNSDMQVTPSAFACIKLPAWANTGGNEQTFYVSPTMFGSASSIVDANILVPALLQNNLDNLSLYATAKMTDENMTFVESAFWKMLQSTHTFLPALQNGLYEQSPLYEPIITYIGTTIDLGNVNVNGTSYTEAYLYIPANAKKCKARWKSIQYAGIDTAAYFPEGAFVENAVGLKAGDTTFVKAIYDIENNVEQEHYNVTKGTDKLVLDFDNIEQIDGDIEFNCIAIYCDVWSLANPEQKTRCLHSLYFVNKFDEATIAGTYSIPLFTKKELTDDGSASSLAFRICTRLASCNTELAPIEVTPVDGISLDMHMETLQQLANQSNAIEDLKTKFAYVEDLVTKLITGIGINKDALTEVNNLRAIIEQQGIYVAPNDLLDMFIDVSKAMKSSDKQVVVNINVQKLDS